MVGEAEFPETMTHLDDVKFESYLDMLVFERYKPDGGIPHMPYGHCRFYFQSGLGQEPIKALIEELQRTLKQYEKMGIK